MCRAPNCWVHGGLLTQAAIQRSQADTVARKRTSRSSGTRDPSRPPPAMPGPTRPHRVGRSTAPITTGYQTSQLGPCVINCSNDSEIYSFHPSSAGVAMCDGSVQFLNENMTAHAALVSGYGPRWPAGHLRQRITNPMRPIDAPCRGSQALGRGTVAACHRPRGFRVGRIFLLPLFTDASLAPIVAAIGAPLFYERASMLHRLPATPHDVLCAGLAPGDVALAFPTRPALADGVSSTAGCRRTPGTVDRSIGPDQICWDGTPHNRLGRIVGHRVLGRQGSVLTSSRIVGRKTVPPALPAVGTRSS